MTKRRAAFQGARLRDARLARGLTSASLAELVSVSPSTITNYERNRTSPSANVLAALAEQLRIPQALLLKPPLHAGDTPCLYRSLSATTKRARDSAEVRYSWLRELYSLLEEQFDFPELQLPDIGHGRHPTELDEDEIEEAATAVRRSWGLGDGPISNVTALVETKGIMVARFAFNANKINGFSQQAPERPFILLNADGGSAVRTRFDVGHELGHLVLHRSVEPREASRPATHKLMESQAHAFAAAFLFPRVAFLDEVYSISVSNLVSLKRRWLVSIQMMFRRARDLGVVSHSQYERAQRSFSARHGRRREPLDDEIPVESPAMLGQSIRMLIDDGYMTRGDVRYRLALPTHDIEAMCGLPRGYLSEDDWGQVEELRPKPKVPEADHGALAKVIRLHQVHGGENTKRVWISV